MSAKPGARKILEVKGDILKENRSMVYFDYKVHNFFSLQEKVDYYFYSPDFPFLDGTWHLKVYPFGITDSNSEGWIGLYLGRKHCVTSDHLVTYTLGMKKEDGTELDSFTYERNFKEDGDAWGRPNFVKRSDLLKQKLQKARNDTIIFFCRLHAKVRQNKEVPVQTVISEGLEKLEENLKSLIDGKDGDVIFRLKDKNFRAHKAILRVRLPILKSRFGQGSEEDVNDIIDAPHCDPAAFQDFLLYLYCGKIQKFSKSTVFDLFWVADTFDVQELRVKSLEFIIDNITMETIGNALKLSVRCKEPNIVELVNNFIKEHAEDVVKTDEWLSFLKEYPVEANDFFIRVLKKNIST